MLHFGRADAECEGAYRPMGAGVAVAANQRDARQRQAELRADYMHDALALLADVEQAHARQRGLLAQTDDQVVGPRRDAAGAPRPCLDHMVGCGKGQLRVAHRHPTPKHVCNRIASAQVVQQVAVDVQQVDTGRQRIDHVLVPDFGEQGARSHVASA